MSDDDGFFTPLDAHADHAQLGAGLVELCVGVLLGLGLVGFLAWCALS